jgi:hypothetical protein
MKKDTMLLLGLGALAYLLLSKKSAASTSSEPVASSQQVPNFQPMGDGTFTPSPVYVAPPTVTHNEGDNSTALTSSPQKPSAPQPVPQMSEQLFSSAPAVTAPIASRVAAPAISPLASYNPVAPAATLSSRTETLSNNRTVQVTVNQPAQYAATGGGTLTAWQMRILQNAGLAPTVANARLEGLL